MNKYNDIVNTVEASSNTKYKFGMTINDTNISNSHKQTPLFAYDYIDIDITEYSFNKIYNIPNDIKSYFDMVKKISSKSIDDLINNKHEYHFQLDNHPRGKSLELLKKILNKPYISDNTMPIMGHFQLYTSDKKSPRIHFLMGNSEVFHILFYDPEHTIHPKKK